MGAEQPKDHTSHHYHKILDVAGFVHKRSDHAAGFGEQVTKHHYEHPGGHRAQVWQYHDQSKPIVIAHSKQSNGIMAPASIETKPQLQRWIDREVKMKSESFAHPFRQIVEGLAPNQFQQLSEASSGSGYNWSILDDLHRNLDTLKRKCSEPSRT